MLAHFHCFYIMKSKIISPQTKCHTVMLGFEGPWGCGARGAVAHFAWLVMQPLCLTGS